MCMCMAVKERDFASLQRLFSLKIFHFASLRFSGETKKLINKYSYLNLRSNHTKA